MLLPSLSSQIAIGTGVKPELAVLKNNPFKAPTYRYPRDLGTVGSEPYIIFDIRNSVARGATSIGTIALYMPPELRTTYNAVYEDTKIDASRYISIANGINQGIQDAFDRKYEELWGKVKRQGIRNTAILTDQITQMNAQALAEMELGYIANPHQANVFQGVQFRDFTYSFVFQPRNSAESVEIQNIIYKFKYHMLPSSNDPKYHTATRFWFYPENFVIGLFSPSDRYLFKISTCVLKSMTVDYAGECQTPSFFTGTGAPVDVRLSLTFRETEILTKERIAEGY